MSPLLVVLCSSISNELLFGQLIRIELVLSIPSYCLQLALCESCVTDSLVNVLIGYWVHLVVYVLMMVALGGHLVGRQVGVINGLIHVNDGQHVDSGLVNKALLCRLYSLYLLLILIDVLLVSLQLLFQFTLET